MNRNRLLLLAGALAAAVVVVVVLIAVAGGGGSSTTTTSAATDTAGGSGTVESTFAGVPQHGDTLGDPKATTTLIVFEDPQCPYCQEWNLNTLPSVVNDYVRTGRLKVVYRGIEIIDANSKVGLRAIYAAGRQNKLWDVAETLYRLQGPERSGWITDQVIRDAANAAGADPAKILAAAKTPAVDKQLQAAERDAQAAGVPGTPTFVVQSPPALPRMLAVTSLEVAPFEASLDKALG